MLTKHWHLNQFVHFFRINTAMLLKCHSLDALGIIFCGKFAQHAGNCLNYEGNAHPFINRSCITLRRDWNARIDAKIFSHWRPSHENGKKKSIAILRVRLIFLSRHFHLTTRLVVISDTYQLIEEIKLGILAPRCNYDL